KQDGVRADGNVHVHVGRVGGGKDQVGNSRRQQVVDPVARDVQQSVLVFVVPKKRQRRHRTRRRKQASQQQNTHEPKPVHHGRRCCANRWQRQGKSRRFQWQIT